MSQTNLERPSFLDSNDEPESVTSWNETTQKLRIIVLGSGFAGMSFVKAFNRYATPIHNYVEVMVISRRDYHLFTPLLYQVATGLTDEHHVADPISKKSKKSNYSIFEAEVLSIDFKSKTIMTSIGRLRYDILIIGLGSVSNDFGIKGVAENAIALKTLSDGEKIRNRILESFEKSSMLASSNGLKRTYLTFAIVGGGATGVELAGSVRDYVRQLCGKYYRIDPDETRVILLEASNRLLPGSTTQFAEKCRKDLESAGIEVRTGASVVRVDPIGVVLSDGSRIETSNVFWTAGTKVNPVVAQIPETMVMKKRGRIAVNGYLEVQNVPDVYAIGDNAWITSGSDATTAPPTAASAVQEGEYLGK